MLNAEKFIAWAAGRGVAIDPGRCVADGKIHRADVDGDARGRNDATYLLRPDGSGWVVNFKAEGQPLYFRGEGVITAAQREEIQRQQAERAVERAAEHARALDAACAAWRGGRSAHGHPYLQDPRLPPAGLRIANGQLMVPVLAFDERGEPVWRGMQVIGADGAKRFASGTQAHGAFAVIPCGDDPIASARELRGVKRIIVCEGVGTALALYEVMRVPVVAALSAGNLPVLAREFAGRVTDNAIFYADADGVSTRPEQDFIGQRMAVEAAVALGPRARVALPARQGGVTPPGYDARDQVRDGAEQVVAATCAVARPPGQVRLPQRAAERGATTRAPPSAER